MTLLSTTILSAGLIPEATLMARGNFLASFDPQTPANFIDQFLATNFDDARLDPTNDHYDHYNTVAVAEFNVTTSADKNSTWEFLIDGNDPVEVEIGVAGSTTTNFTGGVVKASYYGCHTECFPAPGFVGTALVPAVCDANQRGTYKPGSTGYHRVIVRHSERTGQDGVKLWYRKSATDTWKIFPSGLSTRTPDITAANTCTIQSEPVRGPRHPSDYGECPGQTTPLLRHKPGCKPGADPQDDNQQFPQEMGMGLKGKPGMPRPRSRTAQAPARSRIIR